MAEASEPLEFRESLQDQGFFAFLNSLPEKTATTFRFFDRNGYYTVHGQDAIFAAKEIFKTTSVIKYLGSQKVESVALSQLNFESFIRDLLIVRHYRVEIYKSQSTGKGKDWQLECKASPGNLSHLEDLLFGTSELVETCGLLAVKFGSSVGQPLVGVAYADVVCRQFVVGEFIDDDYLSNLESVLVQLSPRECLLPAKEISTTYNRLRDMIAKSNILVTEGKRSDFTAKDIVQDLNNLLKPKSGGQMNSNFLSEVDHPLAMSCTSAIIKYMDLLSDETNFNQFLMSSVDLKQFVRLDSSAVNALNLYPLPGESNKTHSLFSFLNKCCTLPGQRLLSQWLRQPLVDINLIEERLSMVEMLVRNTEMRQILRDNYLKKIPDVPRLAKKFQTKKASLQDCCKVYYLLLELPYIRSCLEKCEEEYKIITDSLFVNPIGDLENDFKKFEEMVETTIDLKQAENGEFLVRPDFDDDLKELSRKMTELEQQIQKQLGKVAKELDLEADKTVKLESAGQLGYYFRVTRKEERALRGKKHLMIIDTKQNGVRFHTPSLKQLNEKYMETRSEYESHQVSVVEMIINIASGYHEPMQTLSGVLARLDVLVSLATASLSAPKQYVRPTFLPKGSGIIELTQARHPCVELQDDVLFVPNSIRFDKEKLKFFIITGPNMGGKSTYIRSVGMIVLMAQIGCFVPCDKAVITVVDAVLARVGAGDKQLKGVSTFMAEMLETSAILRTASEDSLVVIDELGRGTSTYDGFGLAWAISEHISTKLHSYCLFATHFHELTALADEVETVGNLHVTALTANNTLTMLYKVKPGICDQSFGIHVAELAHFPQRIIDFAKEKVREFEKFQTQIRPKNTEPEKKRAKLEEDESEIIHNFLERIKALPLQSMSDDEVLAEVQKLREEVQAKNNPYINELIHKQ